MISIDLNKTLHRLICIYAFLLPFEHILEIWFGIDTVLKPYRLFAILTISIFAFKAFQSKKMNILADIRQDIFLYLLFAYGIFISLFQMIIVPFSTGKFYNELFQITLYLAIFFIIKNSFFSRKELYQILYALVIGVILNSIYVFYNFYTLADYTRPKGFMDNPNYLSLSVGVALIIIINKLKSAKKILGVMLMPLILFMIYIFVISGSRTAFAVVVLALFINFSFWSSRAKILFLAAGISLVSFALSTNKIKGPLLLIDRFQERDATEDPRIYIWKGVMRASEETNYLGMGLGQFEAQFSSFYQDENHDLIRRIVDFGYHLSAHSDYFSILITYGILGLILFLLFLFYSFKKLIPLALFHRQEDEKSYYQLQLILLVSVATFGIASENFNSGLYWLLLTFSTKSVGFLITENTNSDPKQESSSISEEIIELQ